MDAETLAELRERNRRVEADKAWETSVTRRMIIAAFTYMVAFFYMYGVLGVENALLHAGVPTGGYLLSTVSLPVAKRLWIKNMYKNQ